MNETHGKDKNMSCDINPPTLGSYGATGYKHISLNSYKLVACPPKLSPRRRIKLARAVAFSTIFFSVLIFLFSGCSHFNKDCDTVYQVATIDSLLNACYDGSVDMRTIKSQGDTGIGTFNQLDGEMIVLDGEIYKIKEDGTISVVADSETTPFCAVTFFKSDKKLELQPGMKFSQLSPALLGSLNYFYAIKITGKFKSVKARSVPMQAKPYPMLVDVVKAQPVFNLEDIEGTAVGFFSPAYVKGINVPGFHLHFISSDLKRGGHILDFEIEKAEMQTDETHGFMMVLPEDETFQHLDLTKDKEKELNKVEK